MNFLVFIMVSAVIVILSWVNMLVADSCAGVDKDTPVEYAAKCTYTLTELDKNYVCKDNKCKVDWR